MNSRKYLTTSEIIGLLSATKTGRHRVRNFCMIMMAYRHGYRISELLSLEVSDIDIASRQIFVKRIKNGFSTIHPLDDYECDIISNWLAVRESYPYSKYSNRVFISERKGSLSRKQAWYVIKQCGRIAGMDIEPHPHMLRHACGYNLANEGADTRLIQDYLGHRNIRHTVHYTKANSARFKIFLNITSL